MRLHVNRYFESQQAQTELVHDDVKRFKATQIDRAQKTKADVSNRKSRKKLSASGMLDEEITFDMVYDENITSRCIAFRLHPRAMNSVASQSSSSGCDGIPPR